MSPKRQIVKLIKEPSTWAGVASILGGFSVLGLSEDGWMEIAGVIMMAAGVYASLFLDTGDKDED